MNLKNIFIFFIVCSYKTYSLNNSVIKFNQNLMAFVVSNNLFQEQNDIENKITKAEYFYREKKTEEALKLYLEIIESAKINNNYEQLILCNNRISEIFRSIENYKKAILYSKESLKQATTHRDTLNIIKTRLDISTLQYKLYAFDKTTNRNYLDSLITYNLETSKLFNTPSKYKKERAIHFSGIALSKLAQKNYNQAQYYIKEALKINKELKDTIGQVISLNTLAGNNLKLKEFEKAKDQYLRALTLVQTSNSDRKSNLRRMINSNLAWTYYKTKNYIAYEYLKKSNKISDSLRDAEFDAIITEIEAKHNVDIIKQNAAKKQLIQIQEKKQFQVIIIGLAISLVILILIFWIYSKNAKLKDENKDLLIEKTRLMKEKQIEHIESLTRIKILNATLDGKEAERRQIAETLHDSVSALLSAANLHLQASKNKVVGKIPIEIDKTQTIIDEASGKIRNLSHELISSVLLKFGLSYAIQDFCEKYSNTDLEITASTENLQRYDESFEIKTNNIIEELVNNLIKHSKASEGHVNVMEYRKNLHVEIEDNGVGFDTSKKIESNGIGIHQIEARIKMMKGSFKIHSVMGEGTRIEFTIPITYRSEEYSYSQNYS